MIRGKAPSDDSTLGNSSSKTIAGSISRRNSIKLLLCGYSLLLISRKATPEEFETSIKRPSAYGADRTGREPSTKIIQRLLDEGSDIYIGVDETYSIDGNIQIGSNRIYGQGTLLIQSNSSFKFDNQLGWLGKEAAIITKSYNLKKAHGYSSPSIECNILFLRDGSVGPKYPIRFINTIHARWMPQSFIAKAIGSCREINGADMYRNNKNFLYGGHNEIHASTPGVGRGGCWVRDISLRNSGPENFSFGKIASNSFFYCSTGDEPLSIFVGSKGGYINGVSGKNFIVHGYSNGFSVLDLSHNGGRIKNITFSNLKIIIDKLKKGLRGLGFTSCEATISDTNIHIKDFDDRMSPMYSGVRSDIQSPMGEIPTIKNIKVYFYKKPKSNSPVYGFWGNINIDGESQVFFIEKNTVKKTVYKNEIGNISSISSTRTPIGSSESFELSPR